jgi:hypothetical protein
MRAALCLFLVAGGLLFAGCSESKTRADSSGSVTKPMPVFASGDCKLVGHLAAGALRLCFPAGQDGIFVIGKGEAGQELHVEPPVATPSATDAGNVGHWAWAALSPDQSMLIAQWSAECEVPVAFFVPLESGSPSVVTGESDWADSPESVALGWTTDGRAIVFLPKGPACGAGVKEAGVYLYDDEGVGERVVATKPDVGSPVQASIRARDAGALVP